MLCPPVCTWGVLPLIKCFLVSHLVSCLLWAPRGHEGWASIMLTCRLVPCKVAWVCKG